MTRARVRKCWCAIIHVALLVINEQCSLGMYLSKCDIFTKQYTPYIKENVLRLLSGACDVIGHIVYVCKILPSLESPKRINNQLAY